MSEEFCKCNRPLTRSRRAAKFCTYCGGKLQKDETENNLQSRRKVGIHQKSTTGSYEEIAEQGTDQNLTNRQAAHNNGGDEISPLREDIRRSLIFEPGTPEDLFEEVENTQGTRRRHSLPHIYANVLVDPTPRRNSTENIYETPVRNTGENINEHIDRERESGQ